MNSGENKSTNAALELYKLEYERCAIRYENIYQAVWRIFSYLTAVAAGILTFGSNRLHPDLLIFTAGLPPVFWFWSTYLPLDRYGNSTLEQLKKIETTLNEKYQTNLSHFTDFVNKRKPPKDQGCIRRFCAFIKRTKFVVFLFFFPLTLLTLAYFSRVVCRLYQHEALFIQQKFEEIKMITMDLKDLNKLIEKTSGEEETSKQKE